MKRVLVLVTFLFCFIAFSQPVFAQKRKSYKAKTVRVKSYTTKKGTRVKAHRRSRPSRRSHTYIMPLALPDRMAA